MLQDELLPHQWKDTTYRLCHNTEGDDVLNGKQRSWVVTMLRKFLGDKNVAFFILQYCLPELFDAPVRREKPTQKLLQSILDDGMRWHDSLPQSLVEHDKRPGLAHARQTSDLQQTAWRRQKQPAYWHAKQALPQGKRLSEERDSNKISYEEMSATEQQLQE